jgi:hypothetical protein
MFIQQNIISQSYSPIDYSSRSYDATSELHALPPRLSFDTVAQKRYLQSI